MNKSIYFHLTLVVFFFFGLGMFFFRIPHVCNFLFSNFLLFQFISLGGGGVVIFSGLIITLD